MFIRGKEEDAFYDYYVDDGRLYSINSETSEKKHLVDYFSMNYNTNLCIPLYNNPDKHTFPLSYMCKTHFLDAVLY